MLAPCNTRVRMHAHASCAFRTHSPASAAHLAKCALPHDAQHLKVLRLDLGLQQVLLGVAGLQHRPVRIQLCLGALRTAMADRKGLLSTQTMHLNASEYISILGPCT